MRIAAFLLLIIALAGGPGLAVAGSMANNPASNITNDAGNPAKPLEGRHEISVAGTPQASARSNSQPASAQDLAIFGVIALGVIGLLWIRRHTSEL